MGRPLDVAVLLTVACLCNVQSVAADNGVSGDLAKCPDMAQFRTSRISSEGAFKPELLSGLWYEQAYIDFAQIGASCPTMTGNYTNSTGVLTMDFAVRYGKLPFSILELYTPINQDEPGVYRKRVKMPGSKLTQLDCAFVDATMGSDGMYDTMSIYCCLDILGKQIYEINFATRAETVQQSVIQSMEDVARAAGVTWDENKLHVVNRTGC